MGRETRNTKNTEKGQQSQRKEESQGGEFQSVEQLQGFVDLSGDRCGSSRVTLESSTRSLGSIVAVVKDRRDTESSECASGITGMATKKVSEKGDPPDTLHKMLELMINLLTEQVKDRELEKRRREQERKEREVELVTRE